MGRKSAGILRVFDVYIDTTGKECITEGKYLYKYKDSIKIPPLAMMDDLMCISECGIDTVKQNAYVNYKLS